MYIGFGDSYFILFWVVVVWFRRRVEVWNGFVCLVFVESEVVFVFF